MDNNLDSTGCLLEAQVFHSRHVEAGNAFKYPVLNVFLDLAKIDTFNKRLKDDFLNILSIKEKAYLNHNQNLKNEIDSFIYRNFGLKFERIFLQTMPSMFGYVFNPVNFWYCFEGDILSAVLCEVSNTFGEKHYYWLYQEGKNLNHHWIVAKKVFHVSPFFPIQGYYKFRFNLDNSIVHVDIQHLDDNDQLKLITWIRGNKISIQQLSISKLIFKYGWFTPMVVFKIHYQALKLFLKKVTFFKKPQPPIKDISYESTYTR